MPAEPDTLAKAARDAIDCLWAAIAYMPDDALARLQKQAMERAYHRVDALLKQPDAADLLVRYMAYVRECEGVDFVADTTHPEFHTFTTAEWSALERAAEESRRG